MISVEQQLLVLIAIYLLETVVFLATAYLVWYCTRPSSTPPSSEHSETT